MIQLLKSIDDFYLAFSDVPVPKTIDGCAHCIDDKNTEELLSTPRRKVSADTLSSYASSAFLTVGDVADYMYFLPRIMEISITDSSWWPDLEVTARAIKDSGLHTWPDHRHDALVSLLKSWLDEMILTKDYYRLDELMCGVGTMQIDVYPFLKTIESHPQAVLAFWEANAGKLNEGKLGNAFWDRPNPRHDEIVEWFRSEPVRKIYEAAYGYK